MTTFAAAKAARDRTPVRHVVLRSDAFADDWAEKPEDGGEIAIGLRKISDADSTTARAEAAKFAMDMHDDETGQVEAFNDALMRWLVVRGTCDANNNTLNAPLFDGSEENVRNALTSKGIRYVWDEIEKFHLETSPLVPVATNEDMLALAELLKRPELLEQMTVGAALRVRKLLGFCLSELRRAANEKEE